MSGDWLVLIESNTTGTGRLFCASARQLGLRPVAFVRDPRRYPYLGADGIDTVLVDTTDPAELRRAAAELAGPIAGVTSSSEYFIGAASELAGELGLAHPDPDAVRACRDKALQRASLRAAGVPGPQFCLARTPAQAVGAAGQLGLPVVVKPTTGSGSVGVRLCSSTEEVYAATAAVLEADSADNGIPDQQVVLVEQYLKGPEFSVETFDRQVVGITAKHLGAEPHFVEIGHDFPASLTAEQRAALTDTARRALAALRLGWGPAHLELRLTAAGACVVEVNPRLAGGMIPRLVQEATGIDLIELTVARAAGRPTPIEPSRQAFAAIRFLLAPNPGTLLHAGGVEEALRCPGVVAATLTATIGQQLRPQHSFRDRLGYVISRGEDGLSAARAADLALAHLELGIGPGSVPALSIAEGTASQ